MLLTCRSKSIVQSLKQADKIIVLSQSGSIVEQGRFDTLKLSGGYVQSIVKYRMNTKEQDLLHAKPLIAPATIEDGGTGAAVAPFPSRAPKGSKRSVFLFLLQVAWEMERYNLLGHGARFRFMPQVSW